MDPTRPAQWLAVSDPSPARRAQLNVILQKPELLCTRSNLLCQSRTRVDVTVGVDDHGLFPFLVRIAILHVAQAEQDTGHEARRLRELIVPAGDSPIPGAELDYIAAGSGPV